MKACIFLLLLFLSACHATIERSHLQADTRQLIQFSEGFGFGPGARLHIELNDIKIYRPVGSKSFNASFGNFGFFLAPSAADLEDTPGICALDYSEDRRVLFRFNDPEFQRAIMARASGSRDSNVIAVEKSYELKEGGSYRLYFASCETDVPVSLTARIVMYNRDARGRKTYLSVGETELPTMYTIMMALFTAAAAGWAYLLVTRKEQVDKIHILMLALVLLKALTLLCEAVKYHYVGATGRPNGWSIAYDVFTSLGGLMFFIVLVLIAAGWSHLKPCLGNREATVLTFVTLVQLYAIFSIFMSSNETPVDKDWPQWHDMFHLADIICCCAVLFPIARTVKELKGEAAQTDGKTACLNAVQKLKLFHRLYLVVVLYIYFTRCAVDLLRSTLEYQNIWICNAVSELVTLMLYVWVGTKFCPPEDNPYLMLDQDEEADVAGCDAACFGKSCSKLDDKPAPSG